MRGRIFKIGSKLLQRQIVLRIFLHIMDDTIGERQKPVGGCMERAVLLQTGKRGQKGIESQRRIQHIFLYICPRETMVETLEQPQAVLKSRLVVGQYRLRLRLGRLERNEQPPTEMQPIERPTIVGVLP